MGFRLVDRGWDKQLDDALRKDSSAIQIICPFVQKEAAKRFVLARPPKPFRILTRFNLADFAEGVSDPNALRMLLERGAEIRGVRSLHTKAYLIGTSVLVTSANLTGAALSRNHEFGFVSDESDIVDQCQRYFERLWTRAEPNLTFSRLDGWGKRLAKHWASAPQRPSPPGLGDEGVSIGLEDDPSFVAPLPEGTNQAFIKFFGEGSNRADRSMLVIDEVRRSGCHWACAYPKGKRPRQVADGALMFFGRLTRQPNDVRIFGRAIGLAHVPGRDVATAAEIKARPWKTKWPHYIRVHHAEFVGGTLENGVSLNVLMCALRADSFVSTQTNSRRGSGNRNPRQAYKQQPAVALTPEGTTWLSERLERAFARHGKLPQVQLTPLDWPPAIRTLSQHALSANGLRLLRVLVRALQEPSLNIASPDTYLTYKEVVSRMGLEPVVGPGLGDQFEREGGLDLNDWLRDAQLPALTGLVVRGHRPRQPGSRYFTENRQLVTNHDWWLEQMRLALALDWEPYIS